MTRVLLAGLVAFGPLAASAGTTGGICGRVVDAGTNLPVADARVTATSPADVEATQTDAHGTFAFASLIPGQYRVAITHAGYQVAATITLLVAADATTHATVGLRHLIASRATGNLVRSGTPVVFYEPLPWPEYPTYADVTKYRDQWTAIYSGPYSNPIYLSQTPGITFGVGTPVRY